MIFCFFFLFLLLSLSMHSQFRYFCDNAVREKMSCVHASHYYYMCIYARAHANVERETTAIQSKILYNSFFFIVVVVVNVVILLVLPPLIWSHFAQFIRCIFSVGFQFSRLFFMINNTFVAIYVRSSKIIFTNEKENERKRGKWQRANKN